jgi:site-specific recombinase XerD
LKPFLFLRGTKHYARFLIPTAYKNFFEGQKFLTFALGAGEGHEIRKKASTIESQLVAKMQLFQAHMQFDFDKIRKYEIDLARGVLRADGADDHERMIEALGMLKSVSKPSIPTPLPPEGELLKVLPSTKSLSLTELLDKLLLLKKIKPATVTAYKNTTKEFVEFHRSKAFIAEILPSDFSRYKEFLAGEKKNSARTIDSKVGYLKSLLNFGIEQGYLIGKNPAAGKNLLTKRQKLTDGYLIFEASEIFTIFTGSYFLEQKTKDPDYFYILLLEIVTGCRVGELTSICKSQIKKSELNSWFLTIRDSKTSAGKREIPLPQEIFDNGFSEFIEKKEINDCIFKYVSREGKGSGNAVGKKFARHLEIEKIVRGKLVFHSIRKFLNDYFLKNGIEFEARCQFFGHEIDSVNVATYSNKFGIEHLTAITNPVQEKILKLIKLKN